MSLNDIYVCLFSTIFVVIDSHGDHKFFEKKKKTTAIEFSHRPKNQINVHTPSNFNIIQPPHWKPGKQWPSSTDVFARRNAKRARRVVKPRPQCTSQSACKQSVANLSTHIHFEHISENRFQLSIDPRHRRRNIDGTSMRRVASQHNIAQQQQQHQPIPAP